jgi:hypothetical protein
VKPAQVIVIAIILSAGACSSQHQLLDRCQTKISHQLQSRLSVIEPESRVNIIATLSDTIGLTADFPTLRIATAAIALGHLTRDEILSLCRRDNIVRIEIPKTLYPKN